MPGFDECLYHIFLNLLSVFRDKVGILACWQKDCHRFVISLGYTARLSYNEQNSQSKQAENKWNKSARKISREPMPPSKDCAWSQIPGGGFIPVTKHLPTCIRSWIPCPALIPCTHPWTPIQYMLCLPKPQLQYSAETAHNSLSWERKGAQKNWLHNSLWGFPKKQWDTNSMSNSCSMDQGLFR